MRYATAALAIALVLFPTNSFAACPDVSGPTFCCGIYWYTFSFDTSCASTSGSASPTTMWCYSTPSHQFGVGSGTADYTMDIPYGYNSLHWSAEVYVVFNDPSASSNNAVAATFVVYHNGSVTNSQTFLLHGGNQGGLDCNLFGSSSFSAIPGDTLAVYISATNYNSNATIQVSRPLIFGSQF